MLAIEFALDVCISFGILMNSTLTRSKETKHVVVRMEGKLDRLGDDIGHEFQVCLAGRPSSSGI
jgi:hypothetical protein